MRRFRIARNSRVKRLSPQANCTKTSCKPNQFQTKKLEPNQIKSWFEFSPLMLVPVGEGFEKGRGEKTIF